MKPVSVYNTVKMDLIEYFLPEELNLSALLGYATAVSVILLLVYLVQNEFARYSSRIKHLPGPRGWPVVGNLFQVRSLIQSQNIHQLN